MPIDIEGKPRESLRHKLYERFISISDIIGAIVYKDRKITKEEILYKLLPKKTKEQKTKRKTPRTINLYDIKSFFKRKGDTATPNTKRNVGSIILSGIILLIIIIILYIINFIFDLLLEIMEWWVLAILILCFVTPIGFTIGYFLAKDDY